MTFEYDIFISYGHIDDEDPSGDVKGWVDLLVERLPKLVAGYLGSKPKIWRDEQSLHGNDRLQGAIGSGVSRSLLLVPIVSPRYVLSEWCRTELEAFCANEPPSGAGAECFSSRIFKVVKTPLLLPHLRDKEPEQLRDLIGYSFYELEGNRPREFSPDVMNGKDQKYWDMLNRLAWDIGKMLATLKYESGSQQAAAPVAASPTPATPAAPHIGAHKSPDGAKPAKFVYLAETTSDLAVERERVRDELRQRGYGVLPEQKLPLDEKKKTEEAVRADLARCSMSVHLIGAKYGLTPEDDGRSVARIQAELAAEREAAASFQRLLWMPNGLMSPGMEVSDERQKSFITELQNRVTARAELLQMTVEDLKTRIIEKLSPPAIAPAREARCSNLRHVYLICEKRDRPLVRPIREYLFKHQFEVITSFDEGADEKLADYHRKNLKECDAALIYFGNADEPWVRKNLEDLEKAYGYGREKDWCPSAVYVGSPPNEQKEDFLTHKVPLVIRNFSGFNPGDLDDFVSAVERADNGGQ